MIQKLCFWKVSDMQTQIKHKNIWIWKVSLTWNFRHDYILIGKWQWQTFLWKFENLHDLHPHNQSHNYHRNCHHHRHHRHPLHHRNENLETTLQSRTAALDSLSDRPTLLFQLEIIKLLTLLPLSLQLISKLYLTLIKRKSISTSYMISLNTWMPPM